LGIFFLLLLGQLPSELKPLPDQAQFSPWSCDSGRCLLLKSMKDIDRIRELRYLHRSIGTARIVRTHLPDCLGKTAQHFGTLVLLAELRLVQGEPESLPNDGRESRKPLQGVHEPNQLPRPVDLFRHSFHYMPELA
jgi:hypothetical protein